MGEPQGEEVERFYKAIELFNEATKRLPAPQAAMNNAQINVSAGGIGLWVAVTCCIVMMVIGFAGGFLYVAEDRKVDRIQDYLNAVYKSQNQTKEEHKDHS